MVALSEQEYKDKSARQFKKFYCGYLHPVGPYIHHHGSSSYGTLILSV